MIKKVNWLLALLFSIFLGVFGIDRFIMGQPFLGILKLITFGGFGIWWLVDVILIATGYPFKNIEWIYDPVLIQYMDNFNNTEHNLNESKMTDDFQKSANHSPISLTPFRITEYNGTIKINWIFLLIISILLGTLGIDRFIMGQVGLGLLKLITGGGFGIWWIVDIILIATQYKFKNIEWI